VDFLWIVLSLGLGLFLGWKRILPGFVNNWIGPIINIALILLLFAMGAQMGGDREILTQLDRIGLHAFCLAVGSILGSLLMVKLFWKEDTNLPEMAEGNKTQQENPKGGGFLLLLIILALGLGGLSGFFIPGLWFNYLDQAVIYALALLLLGIGLDLGRDPRLIKNIFRAGGKNLLLPLWIALGSIVGAVLTGFLIGLAGFEAAAVGAGFGWYSLSAVIISGVYNVELGTLAFLTNISREVLAILTLPLVAKILGQGATIAPGGATSMDVTLPLIKKVAGNRYVLPAFISGATLSLMVPLLVSLFIWLAGFF